MSDEFRGPAAALRRARGRGIAMVAVLAVAACGREAVPPVLPQLVPGPSPFEYPLSLWDSNVVGTTQLMVHVSSAGSVDSLYVDSTSGYPAFDSAAVAGGRSLRFSPARDGDRAVASWVRVPVGFSHDSAAVTLMGAGGGTDG